MKNLKLLSVQHYSNIDANCFCLDNNGDVYFASANIIYCLSKDSKFLTECTKLESIEEKRHSVIGIEYLHGIDKLFTASSSGDIYSFDLYSKEISNVGTVDSGLEGFAWSPNKEFLVLLTGANSLILMTKNFDPIAEKSLCPDEFGESKPITVGWGSKETQFHGSEGKDAAHVKQKEPKPALSYDDGRPRISWRGENDYFVTSSIHPSKGYRQLRIWSNEAVLQFTGEIKEGLEESVCWRPLGNFICCSQQDANKHKIIFFEKNGLQHGEFVLPFKPNTHKVTHLQWNSDSTVLLIVAESIEASSKFEVMLWTCGNYHWYLKQRFSLPSIDAQKPLDIKWSSNHLHTLYCLNYTTRSFHQTNWAWTVSSSLGVSDNNDDAIVASIDNDNILITPFGKMVVPPPMCAYSYILPAAAQSVSFSPDSTKFCSYLGDSSLAFFQKKTIEGEIKSSSECKIKLVAAGGNGFKSNIEPYIFKGIFRLNLSATEISEFGICHLTWIKENKLLGVCSLKQNDSFTTSYGLVSFDIPQTTDTGKEVFCSILSKLECSVIGMCTEKSGSIVAIQLANGKVLKMAIEDESNLTELFLAPWLCDDGSPLVLPEPCVTMSIISICGKEYILGLTESTERFCLYCNECVILSNCTSYFVHEKYLLATTTDHTLKCILIDYDLSDLKNIHLHSDVLMQRVEKGAKIVIAPCNSTKVILQMPRGNLETIHPRPLVLSCVCESLDNLQFEKAFELSKIHRIDLNILYDHNPKLFFDNAKLFVEQLNSATNINLFLASLKNEDICETLYPFAYKGKTREVKCNLEHNKIDVICDAVRNTIEAKDDEKLFLSLIATYAKKSEPELDEALIRLKKMKDSGSESHQALVDSGLNFLLYLVDVNDLINVALGTYDLEIAIMVAQKSQKDPKEFLPFYNELQNMEEHYKKYKIDIHLKRFKLALHHISKCMGHFDECLSLIKEQRLYIDSLYLFPPSSDKYKDVWEAYGAYLIEKRYYDEAGLVFSRCEDYRAALMAYEKSMNWKSMLWAAMQLDYTDKGIVSLCIETAEKLKFNKKYLDASYLYEHYVKDIEKSIVTLIEGREWSASLFLISKYRRHDISETHLKPALHNHFSDVELQLTMLSTDFSKHTKRLKVVRTQKKEEAELTDVVKHHDEELFSETDSVTDVASTVAESKQLSGSIMTRKSSKSKKKQKLKKYRLREGSADEDLAHIAALSEIVVKIDSLKDNFLDTLKTLVHFGFDVQAKSLQQEMCELVNFVESEIPIIWNPIGNDSMNSEIKFGPDSTANSIAALMQSDKTNLSCSRTDPELAPPLWRKIDLSLQMFKQCI